MVKNRKRKRRLNPIYWIFQYLGGIVAIVSLFFIPYLIEKILGGWSMHTVKYWYKKLLSLQRLADSVGYDIDSDADYIAACAYQPATFTESSRMQAASPEILPLFSNVVERVMTVKNCK